MTTSRARLGPASAPLFVASLFALGQAMQVKSGMYHPIAVAWLSLALLACWAGLLLRLPPALHGKQESILVLVIGLALVWQLLQLFEKAPGWHPRADYYVPFYRSLALAAFVGGAGLSRRPWFGRFHPWLLVLIFLYAGRWIIRTAPDPFIDVHLFQREAVDALFSGQNPWAMRSRDIYEPGSGLYGTGISVDRQLRFGFPYPPLSLLMSALGTALGGDHRYAQLFSIAISALLVAWAYPGPVGNGLAAMFLFTPRSFLIVEQGWTEPYVLLGLSATLTVARRYPRGLPWILGAFLTIKQYLVLVLPLYWLLLAGMPTRQKARRVLTTLGVSALFTLPFALWNLPEFWRSVVALQLLQPFRADSLSYLAWWFHQGYSAPSAVFGFVAAAIAVAVSLCVLPRNAIGFAAGISLTFLMFFAFSKQAFCNYYHFVAGALTWTAALVSSAEDD
jgi:hypothetical protein